MAQYALQGKTVARVKGGDPFIFGRAGEEMAWLNEHGINVEGVSGITAGLAVASALGLPLTHREVSRGVTLVTAHTVDGARPDWSLLARSGLTIVCYMGMNQPDTLQAELLAAGFPATLPVAIAAQVSCAAQRHAVTTLEHLASTVQARQMASPAVIVLGEVVRHAQALPQKDADGSERGVAVRVAQDLAQAIGGEPTRSQKTKLPGIFFDIARRL